MLTIFLCVSGPSLCTSVMYILKFDRNCQNILQSSCTFYTANQQCRSISYSYIILKINLTEENCPFILIYIYFMNGKVEYLCLSIFKRFYLFIFRERGREGKKRGRETSTCGCLLWTPNWGSGPQPRRVPWLGIELMIFWFVGWCPTHWATPVRAGPGNWKMLFCKLFGLVF